MPGGEGVTPEMAMRLTLYIHDIGVGTAFVPCAACLPTPMAQPREGH